MIRCFTLWLGLCVLALCSCTDKSSEEIADIIVLSRNSVALSVEGGATTISVASPSAWSASCPADWVTLHATEGTLQILAADNPTDGLREAIVTLTSARDSRQIKLHQAYQREGVYLSITAPEALDFDSEGESRVFTIVTNGTWTAKSAESWLSVTSNAESRTVELTTQANQIASRSTSLVITAERGGKSKQITIQIAQIARADNPYFKMLGYYGLYASNWYYGGKALGVGGTGTFCTIEQKEYRKSFYIKDLFIKGTVVEAIYNKENGTMSIELGKRCLLQEINPGVMRSIFLTRLNMDDGSFYGGILSGVLGKGADDDGQLQDAILLSGFSNEYKTLGLTVYEQGKYASYSDVYYATGKMYFVRWEAPAPADASPDLKAAAAQIVPLQGTVSALKH